MNITYRPARDADLEAAMQIVADAINDLRARHGFKPDFLPRPPAFQRYCQSTNSGSLWIAERDGIMVGYAFSWMCQEFHFLSQLFIRPEAQAAGIGQTLFERTMSSSGQPYASNRALITLAYNRAATGLYVRNGLFPRQPLYAMQAPARHVRDAVKPTRYETAPLPASLPGWIGDLDAQVLGFRRDAHHRFQASNGAVRSIQVTDAGKPVGYAYITGGHIGPFAVTPSADPAQAINAVIRAVVAGDADQVGLLVPGTADAIMGAAPRAGARIMEPMVLLSAKPFGDWRCYLPNNPGYM